MAKLLERINAQLLPAARKRSENGTLSLDDWSSIFQYGGLAYPLIQTTMGAIKNERILSTAIGAFCGSSSVFALVVARMQAFSQVRFQWTRFSGSQPGDLFGTPELKLLEKPWPGGRTPDMLARMELDNSLCGNAYMVRPRQDRLARLRPDRVQIVLGSQDDPDYPSDAPDVEIAGYAYFPRSGKPTFFFPNEVAHYAPIPDPTFQFLGMSWITACIREVQSDSLMTEHKYRFFENAATVNLAIKFDPSVPIEHVKQFKALLEDEHRGAFNAYKTLYLGGGADPVPVGSNMQQLEFAATQGKGESRLAAAAGVPPSWVGFSEGLQGSSLNAGNFNSARRRFSDGTMQHLWMAGAAALSTVVDQPYTNGTIDTNATLWFDANVPFMREDAEDIAAIQNQQAAIISTLVQQGFTPESVVKAVRTNDWSALKHSGLMSVQLHPPGSGPPAPPAVTVGASNGNGKAPT